MATIKLIQLGDIYPVNLIKVQNSGNRSGVFNIININENQNAEILNRNFRIDDFDFNPFIENNGAQDFSVIIINRPLENDYFTRRISEKLIVISTFNIETLGIHEGISIENYIVRFLLAFSVIFQISNRALPEETNIIQNNSTGCLFDKCIYKPDVAKFFRNPHLSTNALAVLNTQNLPQNFVKNLQKEIKKLKISRYYNVSNWLKKNPLLAIIITYFIGFVFSGLTVSYIYELICPYLPFIK